MNQVFIKVVSKGQVPSRADIAELLASLGKPGENREAKDQAVQQVFDELGHSGNNHQGFSVIETLDSFGEY